MKKKKKLEIRIPGFFKTFEQLEELKLKLLKKLKKDRCFWKNKN